MFAALLVGPAGWLFGLPAETAFAPPIVIVAGGTYSGSWESQDPKTPAVAVNTTAPVVLENCAIRGRSDLIHVTVPSAHVTVRNCEGLGLDPNVAGRTRGDFFFAYEIGSLTLEHNSMEAVSFGVRLYSADGWRPDGPVIVRYNRARNLDGAPSDGAGGRVLTNLQFGQDNGNHFVILANLQGLTGAEIAWNAIVNEPGISSIGDVISIYSSSGTRASPLLVHDNYIQGGYAATPTALPYYAGGITMDGRSSDTSATATAFVRLYGNQIVNQANFGIGIATGHDNEAYGNRAVSSGQLQDGTWVATPYGTGIYVWDCTCYNQPASVYFNNSAHDNVVGWLVEAEDPTRPGTRLPPPRRDDYFLPDCQGGASGPSSTCINNSSLPGAITGETESAELARWEQKLETSCVSIGPVPASSNLPRGHCERAHRDNTPTIVQFR